MTIREAIAALPTSPIAEISALGMGDPDVVALWYGEGDVPTPGFIGEAAAAAMRAAGGSRWRGRKARSMPSCVSPG
jgi:hypothetical protein